MAFAGIVSPSRAVASYDALLRYLEKQLDISVTVVAGRGYAETNRLLRIGDADLGVVCTYAYVCGHDEFGLRLLVAPQASGQVRYRSYIIVPKHSGAADLRDLRGRHFAFTDPLSLTGRIYPMAMLCQEGADPGTFFGKTTYTHSHDGSVQMIASGFADGAAVDSLVYDEMVRRDPGIAAHTKIIQRSDFFASPPIVVGPHLPQERVGRLREALLAMDRNDQGQAALGKIGAERFVTVDDADYDSVRALAREVQDRL